MVAEQIQSFIACRRYKTQPNSILLKYGLRCYIYVCLSDQSNMLNLLINREIRPDQKDVLVFTRPYAHHRRVLFLVFTDLMLILGGPIRGSTIPYAHARTIHQTLCSYQEDPYAHHRRIIMLTTGGSTSFSLCSCQEDGWPTAASVVSCRQSWPLPGTPTPTFLPLFETGSSIIGCFAAIFLLLRLIFPTKW